MSTASDAHNDDTSGPKNGVSSSNNLSIPTGMSADEFVAKISSRVTEEVRSQLAGSGTPPPPPKRVLGDTPKGWASWLIKGAIVVAASFFAWYTFVNDALKERPTDSEVSHMTAEAMRSHEDRGRHQRLETLLEQNSKQIQMLSNVQIRQTAILEAHEKAISDTDKRLERLRDRDR